ncbi:MAG: hypothetical protein PF489_03150 [Salinivirgaceae bacterium]|jgi:hypothetical protein|nr:hypothetical protein [Salinivirgaceae bacterium]
MRKLLKITAIAVLTIGLFGCAAKKETVITYGSQHNVDAEIISVGNDGTKMIKAWGFGKTPELALIHAKRNAVIAAVSHGFPAGGGSGKVGPIVKEDGADTKHKVFFDEFYKDGGKWLQYVNSKNVGMPSGSDRLKLEDGYKVAASVSIEFDALRKYLEDKGVARKLDAGF